MNEAPKHLQPNAEWHRHPNGGGWVSSTANVAETAFVGPNAVVSGHARVYGGARVSGHAQVSGHARVSGNTKVFGNAQVDGTESATSTDNVDAPSHYTSHPSGVECIEIVKHMNFPLGSAMKYIWRAGLKTDNAAEDLRKARRFLDIELERIGGQS